MVSVCRIMHIASTGPALERRGYVITIICMREYPVLFNTGYLQTRFEWNQ